jgi:signal transduction histidine kinase/DNA-binding response OmpR family regulator
VLQRHTNHSSPAEVIVSLRIKITLALVLASLFTALGISWIARDLVQRQFTQTIVQESFGNYQEDVVRYYQTYGSFESALRSEPFPNFVNRTRDPNNARVVAQPVPLAKLDQGNQNPPPNQPPEPRDGARVIRFQVVNEQGVVIIPQHQNGQIAPNFSLTNAKPLQLNDQIIGYGLPDGVPELSRQDVTYLEGINQAFMLAVAVALPLMLLFGFVWGGLLTRPLRQLSKAIAAVGAGKLSERVEVRSRDEIGTLGKNFNHMTEQLVTAYHDLEQAKDAAETASRAKSIFLSNMSHELRTPLNAIIGFSRLMQRNQNLIPADKENLQVVAASGEHLLQLINNVLSMAKIEAGKTDLALGASDIRALLHSVMQMFELEMTKKGLRFELEVHPNVPTHLETDESKLRQVLINVLSNAVKFTKSGGISVQADFIENQLRLELTDTGIGIAATELPKLFKTFEQTQSGIESKAGTGLGLALSKSLVELMGGQIRVQSQVGIGTSFYFTVQAIPASAVPSLVTQRPVIGLIGNAPRILVVDDRLENRQLLKQLLTLTGFIVFEAENGLEAVKVWQHLQPDLIWMDLRMPVMDGFAATKRIRQLEGSKKTIIIALTASVFQEDEARVREQGFDDFIRKPFQEQMLFERMALHLGLKYQYQETMQKPRVEALDFSVLTVSMRQELLQASQEADYFRIQNLLENISTNHPELAEGLRQLLSDYNYQSIMQLLEAA